MHRFCHDLVEQNVLQANDEDDVYLCIARRTIQDLRDVGVGV